MNHDPYKVLVVGPAWIGDMVMANSLFRYLSNMYPALDCDVLAPSWNKPLLQCMPEVSGIIELPLKAGELNVRQRYVIGKKLREKKYDQAIVLPRSFKSALIPFFAKIPKRTGWLGEYRYGVLNDVHRLDKTCLPLMVQRYLRLATPVNQALPDYRAWYPRLRVNNDYKAELLNQFGSNRLQRVAALCPGAAYGPAKRWPAHYFGELALLLLEMGWNVWLFGSNSDKDALKVIQEMTQDRCENFIGKTDLSGSIHLLSAVDLVVANDSGLTHVAAALNKTVIAIYGSSAPTYTPPLSDKGHVIYQGLDCSPCFKRECPFGHYRCLIDIKPSHITQKILKLFP